MKRHGLIFDIQRSCLHDGPGIRTTVFFKGCPLRCLWCHNPEAISFQPQVSFNAEKCISCLSCVEVCEYGAHQVRDGSHIHLQALCAACGNCLPYCTQDALQMIGDEKTVEQVMAVVERDVDYYVNSGGGITLSGGEPMGQFDFALAILQACREHGIHTCLETSGFAPQHKYQQIYPFVDIFLFDFKATETDMHESLVGVPNKLILANLDFLCRLGAEIILRCPLIPGVNDTQEHLLGIAKTSEKYAQLKGLEIMPYHDLGKDKGLRLGMENQLDDIETTSEITKQGWLESLGSMGCERAVIG